MNCSSELLNLEGEEAMETFKFIVSMSKVQVALSPSSPKIYGWCRK